MAQGAFPLPRGAGARPRTDLLARDPARRGARRPPRGAGTAVGAWAGTLVLADAPTRPRSRRLPRGVTGHTFNISARAHDSRSLAPPPTPRRTAGFGTIKAVLSGDTVVLLGKATAPGAPPPELQLSLSHLSAPRLARHADARDEPWAWPSREWLRKAVIGKLVRFRVDYRVEKIGRSFATLWLQEDGPTPLNVRVAAAGWAKVPASPEAAKAASGGVLAPEYDALAAAGKAAEEGGVGLHDTTPGAGEATIRSITWTVAPADAPAIAAQLAAVPTALPAIVEGVINGGLLKLLVPAPGAGASSFLALTVGLAGVQCPKAPPPAAAGAGAGAGGAPTPAASAPAPGSAAARVASGAAASSSSSGSTPAGDAFGSEARLFTEVRLLGREVGLHVTGADKPSPTSSATNAVFWGRIVSPAGDIALELLKAGAYRRTGNKPVNCARMWPSGAGMGGCWGRALI
jgi:staphylococcal nuclease domain-containing protein 1